MEIRKLTINNYEDMVKLWSRAKLPFKPNGRDSRKALATQMKANPDFFLGAFEGNRLIGTVIISCDMRKGWINRLAVDPEYRLRGVAQTLIAELEKILQKHGIKIVCALIEDDNAASKKLFKKLGYVEHRDIIYFSKRESEKV
jgi:ribosomal protein S18 acetylase RimI-like enzyme